MTPPLLSKSGGSRRSSRSMRWRSSVQGASFSPMARMLSCGDDKHTFLSTITVSKAARSCCISRGLIRPVATLETMRSRSPTLPSSISQSSRNSGWRKNCSTLSRRVLMSLTERKGKSTHRRSWRAPMGVRVRSSTWRSERPSPWLVLTSSRLRMVNLSRRTKRSSSMRVMRVMWSVWWCCVWSR